MNPETIAIIAVGVLQAFQTVAVAMNSFIVRDLRDRISRLEDLQMDGRKPK